MKVENYFNNSPVFSIINLAKTTQNSLNMELKELNLSYYQALILVSLFVEQRSNIIVKELVDTFPLTKGAISQNISTLEELKLVKRVSSNDKRSTILKITSAGSKKAQKVMGIFERKERAFEKIMSEQTKSELEDLKLL